MVTSLDLAVLFSTMYRSNLALVNLHLYFCYFVYCVKQAKELKTITFVGKLTFPHQIQSSALNIVKRNGSAGFLTTQQLYWCPLIRGNLLGSRFSCTISLIAWKWIYYLDDGEKGWKEIIGHTSTEENGEGEITFNFQKCGVPFVSGLLVKAWSKNRFVLSGHPKEQLEMRTLAKKFVYKHNNSNYSDNKGLTLVGIKHSVNWKGLSQIRKAFQFLLPGSCSCRGLVFRVTELLVLLRCFVCIYCKIPICKLNQLLICWRL